MDVKIYDENMVKVAEDSFFKKKKKVAENSSQQLKKEMSYLLFCHSLKIT